MATSGPLTIDKVLSQAKKAAKKGDTARAAQLFRAVLEVQPAHPVAKKGLSRLEKRDRRRETSGSGAADPDPRDVDRIIASYRAGRLDEVHRSCLALLERFPRSVIVLNLLGSAYQASGEPDRAVAVFDRAIALNPAFADAYANRANALRDLNRIEAALADYDEASRLRPNNPVVFLNRGNTLKDSGRFGEAIASYETAIQLHPEFAQAHRNLSTLKQFAPGDAQIDQMRRLLDDPSTPDSDRQELSFALAKALDDIGDVENSFYALREGNRLRKKQLGYDIDRDRRLFGAIRKTFPSWLRRAKPLVVDDLSRKPVFIMGMTRSGTTLVEQVLASHTDIYGGGELEAANRILTPFFFGGEQLTLPQPAAMRHAYLAAVRNLGNDERYLTDKMPLNFRWLGFLLTAFPEARVIHVSRDAIATCWSNFRQYFPDEGIGYAYSLKDLSAYYALYRELVDFWQQRFPDAIYDLDYEQLTNDQRGETARLLRHLDVDWQDACLDFHLSDRAVKTASAAQIRQKIYSGSSAAWKRYERYLGPLLALDNNIV